MFSNWLPSRFQCIRLASQKDAPSPGQDLEDMQSLFYLMEEGGAQYRARQFGLALKKYDAIRKVHLKSFHDYPCTLIA